MGELFGSLYCIFEDFFGMVLADYMWGEYSEAHTNQFMGVGISMLAISLVMVMVYYYAVNHPRLNTWYWWGLFLIVNAVINFIVGWQWVLGDYYEGKMVTTDRATGMEVPLEIGPSEIACFGVTNMILSVGAFILFSFIFKWWSSNCSRAPF